MGMVTHEQRVSVHAAPTSGAECMYTRSPTASAAWFQTDQGPVVGCSPGIGDSCFPFFPNWLGLAPLFAVSQFGPMQVSDKKLRKAKAR